MLRLSAPQPDLGLSVASGVGGARALSARRRMWRAAKGPAGPKEHREGGPVAMHWFLDRGPPLRGAWGGAQRHTLPPQPLVNHWFDRGARTSSPSVTEACEQPLPMKTKGGMQVQRGKRSARMKRDRAAWHGARRHPRGLGLILPRAQALGELGAAEAAGVPNLYGGCDTESASDLHACRRRPSDGGVRLTPSSKGCVLPSASPHFPKLRSIHYMNYIMLKVSSLNSSRGTHLSHSDTSRSLRLTSFAPANLPRA
jgi:hypothetical protein